MRRIVCLGDSLTSGHGIGSAVAYPALLHQRVRRAGFPYEVVNAGVSRSTSADARARLDRALEGDVRVLVVALGVNDGLRGVPVAQLTANLSHVIEVAQADAEDMTRRLAREEGIFAGVSSGGAMWSALQVSAEVSNAVIVCIVCDRGDRYLSTGIFPA